MQSVYEFCYLPEQWQQIIAEQRLFILAEAAINPKVCELAQSYQPIADYRLYWGEMGRIHDSISPYCFPVTAETLPMWIKNVVTQAYWGCFWVLKPEFSHHCMADKLFLVMTHLRQWSLMRLAEGEEALLRVADYRVLSTLLHNSTPQEASDLLFPFASVGYMLQQQWQFIAAVDGALPYQNHTSPKVLSPQQYQALNQLGWQQQNQNYQQHLCLHHPEFQTWPEARLYQWIDAGIKQANHYRFFTPQDVASFLSLRAIFGEQFVSEPWAAELLAPALEENNDVEIEPLINAGLAQLEEATS